MSRVPAVAATVGDPAGVGPEVLARALRRVPPGVRVRVYGDLEALAPWGGLPEGVEGVHVATARAEPGKPDPAAAPGIVEAIRRAAADCLEGRAHALVTGPVAKRALDAAGIAVPGQTELLGALCGAAHPVMMLAGGRLRVALATTHCPLREVPQRIDRERLLATLRVLRADLERWFGIARPRIAVCGLNPHAGEGGRFGDEEARIVAPAVEAARAEGIDARGPFAADTLFYRCAEGEFDAVLAMYHDQGLPALKLHAFGRAVNVTLGLPFLRTSPDHGTAYDIAGRGIASSGSMEEALALAARAALQRAGARG